MDLCLNTTSCMATGAPALTQTNTTQMTFNVSNLILWIYLLIPRLIKEKGKLQMAVKIGCLSVLSPTSQKSEDFQFTTM